LTKFIDNEENLEELIIILCTVPGDGKADILADKLVENKLAACVNVIPGIKSIYYWQGEICKDEEKLLLIKTLRSHETKVYDYIKSNHPYQVPERLSLSVLKAGDDYQKWAIDYIQG